MKLIVGLGNPGRFHANNRHNIGFMCLNHFAKKHVISFDKKQSRARIGSGKVANNEVVVAKPQTYVNLSGQSVSLLVKKFNINLDNLLVIHDDLDLPLGKIRIRHGGSSGGHKGIDSIISSLGSEDFSRLRIGIGRPMATGNAPISEADIIAYVLSDFTLEEKQTIIPVIPRVSEAIFCILTEGLTIAMNKYN
ncbi:MAG: aminoacyl-tRNA hydrolase [Dehalococcoidales bacterium]|nr:aminoacyl-tRNA hydrolase [Dehalococcoidales bacterium]